jgi:hypothetical protein
MGDGGGWGRGRVLGAGGGRGWDGAPRWAGWGQFEAQTLRGGLLLGYGVARQVGPALTKGHGQGR